MEEETTKETVPDKFHKPKDIELQIERTAKYLRNKWTSSTSLCNLRAVGMKSASQDFPKERKRGKNTSDFWKVQKSVAQDFSQSKLDTRG